MTRREIKEIVFRTFTDVIADDEAVITENSSIMDDLDMDSIEMQEALSDLEEEFDIEILDSMLKRMITIGDIIDVIRDMVNGCTGRISNTCYRELPVKKCRDIRSKFFLRMQVENRPGVLASIASVFGEHKVSINKVVQKIITDGMAEVVIVTDAVKEYHMQDAQEELLCMPIVKEISSVIREY